MAIGNELRQSIVQAVQTQAVSQECLAQMRGVSVSSSKRVWQRWRQTGSSQVLPHAGGKRPKLSPAQCEQVRQQVQADTDMTLQEVQRWLPTTQTVCLSLPTLSRLLSKLNLPRKKGPSLRPNVTQPRISRSEKLGAPRSTRSTRPTWSLSMKVG
jgi:transposase